MNAIKCIIPVKFKLENSTTKNDISFTRDSVINMLKNTDNLPIIRNKIIKYIDNIHFEEFDIIGCTIKQEDDIKTSFTYDLDENIIINLECILWMTGYPEITIKDYKEENKKKIVTNFDLNAVKLKYRSEE